MKPLWPPWNHHKITGNGLNNNTIIYTDSQLSFGQHFCNPQAILVIDTPAHWSCGFMLLLHCDSGSLHLVWHCRLLAREEGSGHTVIHEPATEKCNGVGSCVFAWWHLHVDDHGSSIYVMLVAVDLSRKRSYMCHPLRGKQWVPSVCSLFAIINFVWS